MFPRWLFWPLFAGIFGFAIGGSLVAALQQPIEHNYGQPSYPDAADNKSGNPAANSSTPHGSKERSKESRWYDKFLEHITDWLLVLFNGILAAFTIRLFYAADAQTSDTKASIEVAKRAATAAETNARIAETALLSVEIPYLYPFIREHGFIVSESPFTKVPAVMDFHFGLNFIKFYFRNFGRTPAEITEIRSILLPQMGFPSEPYPLSERNLNPLSGFIVAADGGESQDIPHQFDKGTFDVYSSQIPRFRLEIANFWFLGFVRYNDVFDNEYVRGFCLGYSPINNYFYPAGGDRYNYRKKTKSGGQPAGPLPSPTA